MIEIRHILCPTDFSDGARRALDQAMAIARWSGARVTVLHVVPPPASAGAAPDAHMVPSAGVLPTDHDALRQEMRQFLEASSTPQDGVDLLVREGPSAGEIVRQAELLRPDLLVMSTHGRSGLTRLILGSVTEHVLREAPCPILIVPPHLPDAVPATSGLYASILCPVDFADASAQALRFAVSLARGSRGRLTVLHVLGHDLHATPDMYDTLISDSGLSDEEYQHRRGLFARQRLLEIVPGAADVDCRVEVVGPDGPPAQAILRRAAEQQSDLIVLGVQPRTGSNLLLAGSTTHDVLRQAACAVLTLRGHPDAE
jgi:nucleotide-binding universal stress UspA family protein